MSCESNKPISIDDEIQFTRDILIELIRARHYSKMDAETWVNLGFEIKYYEEKLWRLNYEEKLRKLRECRDKNY